MIKINVAVILLALGALFQATRIIQLEKKVTELKAWIKASYHSEMDELLTFGDEEAKE